eukprot:gnl/TRDRNA2_/TRDRNA2_173684_c0_seq18.p1 gnl/TRDRNA2_/TRDRNA2_173684_c0~~gnl/TRDRNA2_/TRDRNA2_173684_c0_seq18.p1  ORF type:complete len:103 (+),score=20.33 gnl/TRDRNA2_/TRDRNA2_173684_c0_seq18:336-644(+)
MAWAYATVNHTDEKLCAMLAGETQQRLTEFGAQNLANTSWAFAIVGQQDRRLLAILARRTERHASDFSEKELEMALWALSRHDCLKDAWSLYDLAGRVEASV